jgi:hypothetical protein
MSLLSHRRSEFDPKWPAPHQERRLSVVKIRAGASVLLAHRDAPTHDR